MMNDQHARLPRAPSRKQDHDPARRLLQGKAHGWGPM